MEPGGQCGVQPSIFFLVITLLVTGAATGLLCTAIITDQWEHVNWDPEQLDEISSQMPKQQQIDWFLNKQVARVNLSGKLRDFQPNSPVIFVNPGGTPRMFFVPMFGGLWSFCTTLSESDTKTLKYLDFPVERCTNYLTPDLFREYGSRTDWKQRMQNLSISCALVCLIILCCSALVGTFGVVRQQISAVLVTGVMYLLAATFSFFTLTLIHFKRVQSQAECPLNQTTLGLKLDGVLLPANTYFQPFILGNTTKYLNSRISFTGWSLQLGWGGTGTCVLVSIMWILLSKIMRYNPLSTLLTVL